MSREDPQAIPPTIFLDPWLTTEGDAAKSLSEDIVEKVERGISTAMTRKARHHAIARRRLVVENITANIVTLALSPHLDPGNHLAIATAKTRPMRYDREDYPRRLLAAVLEALEDQGLLIRHPYVFKERNTTVELTGDLLSSIRRHEVRLADIGRVPGAETIWLNARTGETPFGNQPPPKCLIHYTDTPETVMLRTEMQRINAYLDKSDFRYDGEPQPPVSLRRMFLLKSTEEAPAFNLSGRLFGGWWQDLKSDRRHLITIGGEPIADLDYSSCFANLAYVRSTGSLFQGDPYAIPGLEDHRDAAKLATLSLLSRSHDMRRLSPELKEALPEGWTAKRLVESFANRHPALAESFGRDIGVELMATESRIMVALLLRLETLGIAAMGLHDGIQVAASDRGKAAEAMEEVSERLLGVALPVKEKLIKRPSALLAAAA
ncbi:hypothetical protein HB773_04610 [Sinorhizobium meliloti]|nr:hypothetical protein HB773_04610 [Sinorhizobium meliloti]